MITENTAIGRRCLQFIEYLINHYIIPVKVEIYIKKNVFYRKLRVRTQILLNLFDINLTFLSIKYYERG